MRQDTSMSQTLHSVQEERLAMTILEEPRAADILERDRKR